MVPEIVLENFRKIKIKFNKILTEDKIIFSSFNEQKTVDRSEFIFKRNTKFSNRENTKPDHIKNDCYHFK